MTDFMSVRWAHVLMLSSVVLSMAAGSAAGQEEIVARGNQAYEAGEYGTAVEAYEAVNSAGFTSAGLEFNLGNAYFKTGDLARSILHWERALSLSPGDADTRANLELARSLTVDAVEPLPTFWAFSAVGWWVRLLPRPILIASVASGWLALAAGFILGMLARTDGFAGFARWSSRAGVIVVAVMGLNLVVRELGIGTPDRAIVMAEVVAVRSAPAEDDDLTLFEVHEGTRLRIDQRTGSWAEVVLDDGKVGWMPLDAMEGI
jgi:hypothetical protein